MSQCLHNRLPKQKGNMPYGTVKWFNEEKGFGFISPDDGGKDLFVQFISVHFSSIDASEYRTLCEGQRVSYEVKSGQKGKEAAEVRAIGLIAAFGPKIGNLNLAGSDDMLRETQSADLSYKRATDATRQSSHGKFQRFLE
jgi:CspA family cold shock protein